MSAESGVDPAALRIQWEKEKKTYPKSDAEKERIRNILKGNVLFQVMLQGLCVSIWLPVLLYRIAVW